MKDSDRHSLKALVDRGIQQGWPWDFIAQRVRSLGSVQRRHNGSTPTVAEIEDFLVNNAPPKP